MPALTVTLSANAEGSAMGASGVVGRVFGLGSVEHKARRIFNLASGTKIDTCL
jgi:hypothetical protein